MAWHDQYKRVERWLKRIKDHSGVQDNHQEEYEDFLWGYFQNCWHLKDWIKNDPSVNQTHAEEIYRLVDRGEAKNSDALKACSDLANATKHVELHRPRVNAEASGKAFHMHVYDGKPPANPVPDTFDLIVSYGQGQTKEALELAEEALDDWNTIIEGVGLELPK